MDLIRLATNIMFRFARPDISSILGRYENVDESTNTNKFWELSENDDGSVTASWGRIGQNPRTTQYTPQQAMSKARQKMRGGYNKVEDSQESSSQSNNYQDASPSDSVTAPEDSAPEAEQRNSNYSEDHPAHPEHPANNTWNQLSDHAKSKHPANDDHPDNGWWKSMSSQAQEDYLNEHKDSELNKGRPATPHSPSQPQNPPPNISQPRDELHNVMQGIQEQPQEVPNIDDFDDVEDFDRELDAYLGGEGVPEEVITEIPDVDNYDDMREYDRDLVRVLQDEGYGDIADNIVEELSDADAEAEPGDPVRDPDKFDHEGYQVSRNDTGSWVAKAEGGATHTFGASVATAEDAKRGIDKLNANLSNNLKRLNPERFDQLMDANSFEFLDYKITPTVRKNVWKISGENGESYSYRGPKNSLRGHLEELHDNKDSEDLKKVNPGRHEELNKPKDVMDEELGEHEVTAVKRRAGKQLDNIFSHLERHKSDRGSGQAFYEAAQSAGLSSESILNNLGSKNTLSGMLQSLHSDLGKLDTALAATGSQSQNSAVRREGSYGNMAYNDLIKDLETNTDFLPEGYGAEHTRKIDGPEDFTPPPASEMAKRAEERKQRELEERRRQEGEDSKKIDDMMPHLDDMMAHMESRYDEANKRKIALGMHNFFADEDGNSNFSFKRWLNQVQPGNGTSICRIDISPRSFSGVEKGQRMGISFRYFFHEKNEDGSAGRRITEASRSLNRNSDGSFTVNNSCFSRVSQRDLKKHPGLALDSYEGSETMLREVTKNMTGVAREKTRVEIGEAANGGFSEDGYAGAIVWAKHRYDWQDQRQIPKFKTQFKKALSEAQRQFGMSDEDIEGWNEEIEDCEFPYQFVELRGSLSREQMGQYTNPDIRRMTEGRDADGNPKGYPLGAWLLLKTKMWYSAVNYVNQTEGRGGHLNEARKKSRDKTRKNYAARGAYHPNHVKYSPDRTEEELGRPYTEEERTASRLAFRIAVKIITEGVRQ